MKREITNMGTKVLTDMSKACKDGGYRGIVQPQLGWSRKDEMLRLFRSNCQNLAIVGYNGKELEAYHLNATWCAAGLQMYEKPTNAVECIVSLTQTEHYINEYGYEVDEEHLAQLREEFFTWFLKESPYRKCIVTKSVKVAMNKGIIYDAEHPANYVVGAIISSRIAWEHLEILYAWERLVKAGMNKSKAFVVAHSFIESSKGVFTPRDCGTGHTSFDHVSKNIILNFAADNMVNATHSYKGENRYDAISVLWGENDYSKLITKATERAVTSEEDIPNPFSRSLEIRGASYTLYSDGDFVNFVEEIEKELL